MAINRIKTGSITDGTIQSGDLAPGTVANDRLANNTITINGTSIALGASGDIVAGTDWQAVTVADGSTTVNTVAGGGYLLDTNAGVIEAFLPSSPSRGDTVVIADYSGTFGTNRCIVNTGGENLDSTVGTDFQLTTNNTIAEFIYIDSSKGWLVKLNQAAGTTPGTALGEGNIYDQDASYIVATGGTVTEVGDYKVHTFTGDGCFTVCALATGAGGPNNVSYLVVAGGGGGGRGSSNGAGGGAGGYREGKDTPDTYTASPLVAPAGLTVTATTYPITVGGGAATQNSISPGTAGSPSSFSTITSAGGGFGGAYNASPNCASSGGSGGGGADAQPAGSGNTPPTSPPQGQPGGVAHPGNTSQGQGAGGGAGQTGNNGLSNGGGDGGDGVGTAIGTPNGAPGPSPSLKYFSGGGGGGMNGGVSAGSGGYGGGGNGSINNAPGGAGSGNTGGGGGGNGPVNGVGGAGGKGIVVIRYKFQ